jgi:hypothetical protein
MTKIRVKTNSGIIRIKLQDEVKAPVDSVPPGAEPLKSTEPIAKVEKGVLLLPTRLINLMEIRAESGFRPNEEDVEIVYALSGSSSYVADMLHKLSSQTVVEEAKENYIVSSVQGMIEHVVKERDNPPKLVVAIHTHPQGIPKPSDMTCPR